MSCTGFRQTSLDGLVDVCAPYIDQRDGLVLRIHDREILDVLETPDDDTGLHPACPSVREVVEPFRTFVDDVGGIGVMGLDDLPGPCPGEIGKVALPLHVLVAVDRIERREYGCVLLHGVKWIRVKHIQKEPPPKMGTALLLSSYSLSFFADSAMS